MKIQAVIFDLGNVLIQYDTGIFIKGFMQLSGKPRKVVVDAFLSAYSGRFDTGESSARTFYEELNSGLEMNVSFEEFKKVYCDIFFERKEFKNAALEINSRYHTAVLSNTDILHHQFITDQFPWVLNIPNWFVSYEMGCLKPDNEIYDKTLKAMGGLKPEETLFIDDRIENIEGAQAFGLKTIHFTQTAEVIQQLKEMKVL